MGRQAEDKVALISHNNRCEWNIMDHGIMQAGGIDVPIYPTMTEEIQVHPHPQRVQVLLRQQRGTLQQGHGGQGRCPALEEVFTFEDVKGAAIGRKWLQGRSDAQQAELDARRDAVDPAQLATIIYTSGTTGLPKGVMLSHNNVASNVLVAEAPRAAPSTPTWITAC